MSLVAGSRLGPYEIVAPLGSGGMGVVFKARDTRLDRVVAIKVLPDLFAFDQQFRDRFQQEARAIASLSHPNICTLHDVGDHEGRRFFVMELLEGETLATRVLRDRIPYHTLLAWSVQLADALSAAHQKGILHRDLKPANLFITTGGAIKILDFGLAKRTDDSPEVGPTLAGTQVGTAVGTVAYMSPEQARGEALDGRSDLFSLGAVLYEAATGQPAFTGATSAAVFEAIFSRNISRRAIPSPFPAGFAAIVERLLAKRPADRYASASELAAALRDLAARRDSELSRAAAGTSAVIPSIAVLPFADMSAQKDHEYFCEGMAEELINALAKLQGLRVASRTSAFRFKGAADIHKVGQELGVDTVLEGSVRTAGSRLRVSAQLVNAANGYQMWSERFDRQLEDVFDIQDEIARAIVEALKVTLLGDQNAALVKRGADNVEAYQLCLKARYYWHRWTDDGFRKAFELFEEAVQADSKCALAHFGLADCYTAAGSSGLIGPEFQPKAEALFETAIALDPDLAEAHAILGILRGISGGWDWRRAEELFVKALRLSPRSAHVHSAYSLHLLVTDRADQAVKEAREAVQLDPLLPSWHVFDALIHYLARNYEKAVRAADLALELDARNWWAQDIRALSLTALGDRVRALEGYQPQLATTTPYAIGNFGFMLAKAGRREEAEEQRYLLVEHAKSAYVGPVSVTAVCAGLGLVDEAFSWLNRAVEEHDPQLAFFVAGAITADDLRPDPRFAAVRRQIGL
jgi:TolB-like protein/Tfp pilus assembly protein PilF/aminoglycoside phosphotransferase (APT) family kinase protein